MVSGRKRRKREYDDAEFGAFARRIAGRMGVRAAAGDEVSLRELAKLRDAVEEALTVAVTGLRTQPKPYSWEYIAAAAGVTRQGAIKKWGGLPGVGTRRRGGQPLALR